MSKLEALAERAKAALEHKSRSYFADARDFGEVILALEKLAKCQHSNAEVDDDGEWRSWWCPDCGANHPTTSLGTYPDPSRWVLPKFLSTITGETP